MRSQKIIVRSSGCCDEASTVVPTHPTSRNSCCLFLFCLTSIVGGFTGIAQATVGSPTCTPEDPRDGHSLLLRVRSGTASARRARRTQDAPPRLLVGSD